MLRCSTYPDAEEAVLGYDEDRVIRIESTVEKTCGWIVSGKKDRIEWSGGYWEWEWDGKGFRTVNRDMG
jgi:hypothetical protein